MAQTKNNQVTYPTASSMTNASTNPTVQARGNLYEEDFRKKGYTPTYIKGVHDAKARKGYFHTDAATGKTTYYDPYTGQLAAPGTYVYTSSGVPYVINNDYSVSESGNTDFVDPTYLATYGTPVSVSSANGAMIDGARTINNITYDKDGNRIPTGSLTYADNGVTYQYADGSEYGVPYSDPTVTQLDPYNPVRRSIADYMREYGVQTKQDLYNNYADAANRAYQQELDSLNYANLENQRTLVDEYRRQMKEQADTLANSRLNGGSAGAQFALLSDIQQANQEGIAEQLTAAEEKRRELLDQYEQAIAEAKVNAANQYDTNAMQIASIRSQDEYNQTQLLLAQAQLEAARAQAEAYKNANANGNSDLAPGAELLDLTTEEGQKKFDTIVDEINRELSDKHSGLLDTIFGTYQMHLNDAGKEYLRNIISSITPADPSVGLTIDDVKAKAGELLDSKWLQGHNFVEGVSGINTLRPIDSIAKAYANGMDYNTKFFITGSGLNWQGANNALALKSEIEASKYLTPEDKETFLGYFKDGLLTRAEQEQLLKAYTAIEKYKAAEEKSSGTKVVDTFKNIPGVSEAADAINNILNQNKPYGPVTPDQADFSRYTTTETGSSSLKSAANVADVREQSTPKETKKGVKKSTVSQDSGYNGLGPTTTAEFRTPLLVGLKFPQSSEKTVGAEDATDSVAKQLANAVIEASQPQPKNKTKKTKAQSINSDAAKAVPRAVDEQQMPVPEGYGVPNTTNDLVYELLDLYLKLYNSATNTDLPKKYQDLIDSLLNKSKSKKTNSKK